MSGFPIPIELDGLSRLVNRGRNDGHAAISSILKEHSVIPSTFKGDARAGIGYAVQVMASRVGRPTEHAIRLWEEVGSKQHRFTTVQVEVSKTVREFPKDNPGVSRPSGEMLQDL